MSCLLFEMVDAHIRVGCEDRNVSGENAAKNI